MKLWELKNLKKNSVLLWPVTYRKKARGNSTEKSVMENFGTLKHPVKYHREKEIVPAWTGRIQLICDTRGEKSHQTSRRRTNSKEQRYLQCAKYTRKEGENNPGAERFDGLSQGRKKNSTRRTGEGDEEKERASLLVARITPALQEAEKNSRSTVGTYVYPAEPHLFF